MKKQLFRLLLLCLCLALACLAQPAGPCTQNADGAPPMISYGRAIYTCSAATGQNWSLLWAPNTNFGETGLRLAHAQYNFSLDGGAIGTITPVNNFTLPAKAVITNVSINSTTAVTSLGSATVAIGTTLGSSATSLLAATAKASLSANAFVQGVPVPQTASTFIKMSAAGQLQITVAVAALTAGVIEVYVWYYVSTT